MKTEYNVLLSANVLVVDEDSEILRLLSYLLEKEGHRVRTATDGNQCLQMILQDCPDVLITDWALPGLDGLEICRRVRQLHARKVLPHYTFILLLTPQSGKKSLIEGLEAGADNVVDKMNRSPDTLQAEITARLKVALRTRKLEIDLEFAAKYDSLTMLYNRMTFFEMAQLLWDRSIKNKFPLSAVMFDCDFFKRVNDIHGHIAGDAVLREMALILKEFSRSSDIICRYGGEEFCILLPGCNEKTAWNWAERIRRQFENNPICSGNLEIGITVSFGVSERLGDTAFIDQLIERADQALLFAKESGRNRCVRFSDLVAVEPLISSSKFSGVNSLFLGITAADVMAPFPLMVSARTTVASVVHFFLKTRLESLPVVDEHNELIGMVAERSIIPLIGNITRWQEPISDLITPNTICYPAETPLRIVYDFLCRVSAPQVLLLRGKTPVGYINRTPLLRWLRDQWAVSSGQADKIIPHILAYETHANTLLQTTNALIQGLKELERTVSKSENEIPDRSRLVTLVSQTQDKLDQILKYASSPTDDDMLSQLEFF